MMNTSNLLHSVAEKAVIFLQPKKILGIDTETTSAVPATARMVQIAALLKENGLDGYDTIINTLCDPEVDISAEAAEVHGITKEMVAGKLIDKTYAKQLYNFLKDNQASIILVGHNLVTFDMPIIYRLAGEEPLEIKWIDTLTCATRVLPQAPNHQLSGLVEWLKLGAVENAHDAAGDIEMVFKLLDYFCSGLAKTPEELADWCAVPRVLKTCHFGKHKGKDWGIGMGKVPKGYVHFICGLFDNVSPDMVATIKHHYNYRFKLMRGKS